MYTLAGLALRFWMCMQGQNLLENANREQAQITGMLENELTCTVVSCHLLCSKRSGPVILMKKLNQFFPLFLPAEGKMNKIKWILTWPLIFVLFCTIPNCSKPRWESWFMFTFILSTLWIALFSYFMVWMVSPCSKTCHRE